MLHSGQRDSAGFSGPKDRDQCTQEDSQGLWTDQKLLYVLADYRLISIPNNINYYWTNLGQADVNIYARQGWVSHIFCTALIFLSYLADVYRYHKKMENATQGSGLTSE